MHVASSIAKLSSFSKELKFITFSYRMADSCVELDILVFFLFLRTLYKIIELKAVIYTFFRLKNCVLD